MQATAQGEESCVYACREGPWCWLTMELSVLMSLTRCGLRIELPFMRLVQTLLTCTACVGVMSSVDCRGSLGSARRLRPVSMSPAFAWLLCPSGRDTLLENIVMGVLQIELSSTHLPPCDAGLAPQNCMQAGTAWKQICTYARHQPSICSFELC